MALVLFTGTQEVLVQARKILQKAGHGVLTAGTLQEIQTACESNMFDVVVVGQRIFIPEKNRIWSLVREKCPAAKVLEVFTALTGRSLSKADDWLEVQEDKPAELAERVSALASEKAKRAGLK